jgi:ketosteroid isomerase-like protein
MRNLSSDTTDLLHRYVAAWNEADPARRRGAVRALYSERALVVTPSLEVNGAEAILEHIGEVFAKYVATGDHRFRRTASTGHHRSVLLHWELAVDGQPVAGSGLNVLFIGRDGRIEADHQFRELDPVLEPGSVTP